jgi:hypothetical protein
MSKIDELKAHPAVRAYLSERGRILRAIPSAKRTEACRANAKLPRPNRSKPPATKAQRAAYRAAWYRANRERLIARQKAYYLREKPRILAFCKARYQARKEGAK